MRIRSVPASVPEPLGDVLGAAIRVGRRISLPVDESALDNYRRRQRAPLVLAGAATGILGYGLIGGYLNWIGAVLGVAAIVLQARNRRRYWVQVRRRTRGGVIVLRAHEAFDRQARQLHSSTLRRGP